MKIHKVDIDPRIKCIIFFITLFLFKLFKFESIWLTSNYFLVIPVNGSFGMDGEKMMADQAKHSFHDLPFWSAESRKMMAMFGEMYRSCKGQSYYSYSLLLRALSIMCIVESYWITSKLVLQYSWRTRNSFHISKKANTILRLPISTTTALLASFTRRVSFLFHLRIKYHYLIRLFQRFQHGSGSVLVLWLTTSLTLWASLYRLPIALVSFCVFGSDVWLANIMDDLEYYGLISAMMMDGGDKLNFIERIKSFIGHAMFSVMWKR